MPDPLFDQPVSAVAFSKDNNLLGAHIASDGQWRFPPIENLPEKFITCITTFEDKRFFQHHGVDPLALARAMKQNVIAGGIVSGGSTITMQTIRLVRGNKPRTITEKIIEALMALRLELRYEKTDILKFYASHAPFGGNTVGLEAAAWRYYQRTPDKLSWAEMATLAVLPNSPALIHPGKNQNALKEKRNRLLTTLFKNGVLNQLDYDLAIHEELPAAPKALPRLAPQLLETLMQTQSKTNQRFHTTLDRVIQQSTLQIATNYATKLERQAINNLAILVIDNKNFEVVAYVANSPIGDINRDGRAMDLIHRPRSTGSILKPLLFAAMIEDGDLLPETLVADTPTHYPGYTPKNFDRTYQGAIPAKYALTRSLNIPAANLLSQYGVAKFQDFLKNFGMTTLHRSPRDYGLTLILGGAEGTLWDVTSMYANLARLASQSRYQESPFYLQPIVLQKNPKTTEQRTELSAATAWMTLDMLLDVKRPGAESYWKRFSSSQKIAWKTGTSYGFRDAWAVGVNQRYTVGVWVGNADGMGNPDLIGTKLAGPLLFDVFNRLPKNSGWFSKPHWQMQPIKICKKDGFIATELCEPRWYQMPKSSHFDRTSPYHQLVHLDTTGAFRVDSRCESVNNMQHQVWFVLPPDQAFYYQRAHADYKPLPPWRPDCVGEISGEKNVSFKLVYPAVGMKIYLPEDLDGKLSQVVFHAIHTNPKMLLFWHLDNQYVGMTETFHQLAQSVKPGQHVVTVLDEQGQMISHKFTVIGRK